MRLRPNALLAVLFLATSCASAPPGPAAGPGGPAGTTGGNAPAPPAAPPALDTPRINRLITATAPDQALQINFDWSLQDRDFKFQGKGVMRTQGPYHARIDLFGPQDFQVLRGVMIQDSLELVYVGPRVPLPPASFLWSILGVVRPPVAGPPATITKDGSGVAFTYEAPGAHWRFRADSATLKGSEWTGDDGGRRTVELTGPFTFGRPTKAVFRDWREFRELGVTVTSVTKVEPFAPDIWNVSNR